MIWRKVFERTSILGGWWCELDDHSFLQSIHSTKYPFFYSSFSKNHPERYTRASAAWNWINSVSQPAGTTFAFPSVWFFFFACCPKQRINNRAQDNPHWLTTCLLPTVHFIYFMYHAFAYGQVNNKVDVIAYSLEY